MTSGQKQKITRENRKTPEHQVRNTIYTIVCSISFRIIVIQAVIMAIVFLAVFLKQKQNTYESAGQYFSSIGAMASEILAGTIADDEAELYEIADADFLDQLQHLCAEYDISDIFLAKSEPPYTTSEEIIYVDLQNKIVRNENDSTDVVTMNLSDEEQKVFSGELPFLYTQYESGGRIYSAYLSGLYNDEDHCFAVVGVDFLTDNIRKMIDHHIAQFTGYLVLSVALSCLVIILGLHFLVIKPVKKINKKLEDFVSGDKLNPEHMKVTGRGELAQISASYNMMVDDVTQYFQTLQVITAAAEIQKGLLPAEHFENQAVRIDAFLKPAKYVGGDFYDYYLLDEEHICFVIADVSGKGMSAAMFMVNAVNAIKYNAKIYSMPSDILYAANNDLSVRNPELLFVTAFIAVYDCKNHKLTYSNGGHNRPYILRNRHTMELSGAGGLLLGLFPDETYQDCTIDILPDDILFLYTDGLNEAVSSEKTFFGEQRIEEVLEKTDEEEEGKSILEAMKTAVDAFTGDAEPHDDLTMLSAVFYSRRQLQIGTSIKTRKPQTSS